MSKDVTLTQKILGQKLVLQVFCGLYSGADETSNKQKSVTRLIWFPRLIIIIRPVVARDAYRLLFSV